MTPNWSPKRNPATPPMRPPSTNVSEMVLSMCTPMRLAVSASWATARMPLPSLVLLTTVSSTIKRTKATTMVTIQVDWTPTPQTRKATPLTTAGAGMNAVYRPNSLPARLNKK